tara:strand:+ start:4589 stop:6130 length:1542 start_codon:yes stop_codon:yes gene_type:complete
MSENKFYITTPIYYPSGKPHMGHAYSSIIADIIARFKKIEGCKVYFLTGTDEHGLKIEREANKNKKEPREFCNEITLTFKNLTKTLNLSNNDFIRTTEERHYKSVKEIWLRLEKSGDIYLDKYSGWYSVSDEAYYDDDEIIDDKGSKKSKISGSKVEWVEEESYFFKLSKWEKKLLDFYEKNPDFILPKTRRKEVVNFVKKGLKDLSVSRTSFKWGIPVPSNNKHIIYVWLDALTNYISALNFPDTNNKLYKDFWPANIHIIGKDILRFHAIYWPAFLFAAKLQPPKRVFGHGWILSNERKMSKSLGNILDPIEIINKYGVDQLRYYLVKEVSLGNDGSISLDNLKNCINNDLANNFGNLCQRVFTFIDKNCDSKIPSPGLLNKKDKNLINEINNKILDLKRMINYQDLNSYVKEVINFSFNSNKYFNDEEPWKLKKTNTERMNTVLYCILNQIKSISILLYPIMPGSMKNTLKRLGVSENNINLNQVENFKLLKSGSIIIKGSILFEKIDSE